MKMVVNNFRSFAFSAKLKLVIMPNILLLMVLVLPTSHALAVKTRMLAGREQDVVTEDEREDEEKENFIKEVKTSKKKSKDWLTESHKQKVHNFREEHRSTLSDLSTRLAVGPFDDVSMHKEIYEVLLKRVDCDEETAKVAANAEKKVIDLLESKIVRLQAPISEEEIRREIRGFGYTSILETEDSAALSTLAKQAVLQEAAGIYFATSSQLVKQEQHQLARTFAYLGTTATPGDWLAHFSYARLYEGGIVNDKSNPGAEEDWNHVEQSISNALAAAYTEANGSEITQAAVVDCSDSDVLEKVITALNLDMGGKHCFRVMLTKLGMVKKRLKKFEEADGFLRIGLALHLQRPQAERDSSMESLATISGDIT